MKQTTNYIDYGVYIDRKKAIIVALDQHEAFIDGIVEENHEHVMRKDSLTEQEHAQHRSNESLKKFCRAIVGHINDAHKIVVFGPASPKFELQNEIRDTKRLKNVPEELAVTDVMDDKEVVLRYVRDHYTPVVAGHQVFTAKKK
jgi:hypothetical protein